MTDKHKDAEATREFQIFNILVTYCGQTLTPNKVDEIREAMNRGMKDPSVSWCFDTARARAEALEETLRAIDQMRNPYDGFPTEQDEREGWERGTDDVCDVIHALKDKANG